MGSPPARGGALAGSAAAPPARSWRPPTWLHRRVGTSCLYGQVYMGVMWLCVRGGCVVVGLVAVGCCFWTYRNESLMSAGFTMSGSRPSCAAISWGCGVAGLWLRCQVIRVPGCHVARMPTLQEIKSASHALSQPWPTNWEWSCNVSRLRRGWRPWGWGRDRGGGGGGRFQRRGSVGSGVP